MHQDALAVDVREAARRLSLSPRTVATLVSRGELPSRKVGRRRIIPVAALLVPMIRIVPMAYQWRIKRRMMFWYGKLKQLERQIRSDRSPERIAVYRDEIHRIEEAVSVIPIPLAYSDQLYTLRTAIDLVKQRIASIHAAA